MFRITPAKIIGLLAFGYFIDTFVAVYIAAAVAIYTAIGDNTR
jgi:hypothetical protein